MGFNYIKEYESLKKIICDYDVIKALEYAQDNPDKVGIDVKAQGFRGIRYIQRESVKMYSSTDVTSFKVGQTVWSRMIKEWVVIEEIDEQNRLKVSPEDDDHDEWFDDWHSRNEFDTIECLRQRDHGRLLMDKSRWRGGLD